MSLTLTLGGESVLSSSFYGNTSLGESGNISADGEELGPVPAVCVLVLVAQQIGKRNDDANFIARKAEV